MTAVVVPAPSAPASLVSGPCSYFWHRIVAAQRTAALPVPPAARLMHGRRRVRAAAMVQGRWALIVRRHSRPLARTSCTPTGTRRTAASPSLGADAMKAVVRSMRGPQAQSALEQLQQLCADSSEQRAAARRAGAIEALGKLLRHTPHPLCATAARALANVCLEEESQAKAASLGIIESLVLLVGQAEPHVGGAAAAALSNICLLAANRPKAADAGAIVPLVRLLSNNMNDAQCGIVTAAVAAAAAALGNICASADNLDRADTVGAVDPLVQLLCRHAHAPAQCLAVFALGNLCISDTNKALAAHMGAILPLVRLLGSPSKTVVEAAAGTLNMICSDTANCQLVGITDAVQSLVPLVSHAPASIAKHAALALWNICAHSDAGCAMALQMGAVQSLMDLLRRSTESDSARAAVGALNVVCARATAVAKDVAADAMVPLLRLLQCAELEMRDLATHALWAIFDGASNETKRKAGPLIAAVVPLLCDSSDSVAEAAARILAEVSAASPDCLIAAAVDATQSLVRLLNRKRHRVQAAAAMALSVVCRNAPSGRAACVNAGAIPALVALLFSSIGPVRVAAAAALRDICIRYDADTAGAAPVDTVVPLVQQLCCPSEAVQEASAWALRLVCLKSGAHQAKASDAGAVERSLQLLDSPCGEVQVASAELLHCLAAHDAVRVRLMNADAIPKLVLRLSHSPDGLVAAAAAALEAMCSRSSECQLAAASAGAIPPLVQMLHSESADLQRCSARALWSLCINATNHALAADAGAIPPLVHLLGSSTSVAVQEAAAGTLWNLCWVLNANRVTAIHAGAVRHLAYLCQHAPEPVKDVANEALMKICGDNAAIIAATRSLAAPSPDKAAEAAMRAAADGHYLGPAVAAAAPISSACASPAAPVMHHAAATGTVAESVAGLVRLLRLSPATDTTAIAATILATVCMTNAGIATVAEQKGAIEALVALLDGASSEVQRCAVMALAAFGNDAAIARSHEPARRTQHAVWSASDERLVAVEAPANRLRVWQSDTGRLMIELLSCEGPIVAVGMTEGRIAVASGTSTKHVHIYDVASGALVADHALDADESVSTAIGRLLGRDSARPNVPIAEAPAAQLAPASPPIGPPACLKWPEVALLTENFSRDRVLGEGGFGRVYRAQFRNVNVAIKVLQAGNLQGDREFEAEVATLSQLRHRNIIALLGWSCGGSSGERALVYQLAPNGSVRERLDCKDHEAPLSWPQRLSIAVDVARAMDYLQTAVPQQPVFHLDLKSDNILLDAQMVAKVGDFGLNRRMTIPTDAIGYLHTETIRGTLGYICPEYRDRGRVCRTTDVYSYGIVVMELLTARIPDGYDLCAIVRRAMRPPRSSIASLLDARLEPLHADRLAEANAAAALSVRCTELSRLDRPIFSTILFELTAGQEGRASGPDDGVENADIAVSRECIMCRGAPIDVQLRPCHHSATCHACATSLLAQRRGCPVCHTQIAHLSPVHGKHANH